MFTLQRPMSTDALPFNGQKKQEHRQLSTKKLILIKNIFYF